jgi:hypothetical protein
MSRQLASRMCFQSTRERLKDTQSSEIALAGRPKEGTRKLPSEHRVGEVGGDEQQGEEENNDEDAEAERDQLGVID